MNRLNFNKIAKQVISTEIQALKKLQKSFGKSFTEAVDLIAKSQGKLILAGIGKSGLISTKGSATLSSLGTPSFFLHVGDAAHGDLGVIGKKDILLILSYSGQTEELKNIIQYANRFSIPLIGVASKTDSLLLKASDIKIILPEVKEAGIGSLAPTSSSTMFCAFLDSLAVALSYKKKFSTYDFKNIHPGGSLFKKLTTVEDLMYKDNDLPLISENTKFSVALNIMSKKKLGSLVMLNKKKFLSGFLSDGDVRRKHKKSMSNLKVKDIMTKNPLVVQKDILAAKAIKIMQKKRITALIVGKIITKNKIKVIGLIHIHQILRAGI
jgi:arabinose-5-phosphate isomerase|tara:strand:+ start:69 stop:1040 length:972 start_codon:yes stop_codon:yes gene_type:complete